MKEKIKKTNAFKIYMEKSIDLQDTQIVLLKMTSVVLKRILGYERSLKLFERTQKISPRTTAMLKDIKIKKQELEETSNDYEKKEPIILEMFFIADINAYLVFIQDLMLEVYCKNPNFLADKEVKIYDIITKKDIGSIVKEKAELVIAGQMYQDFKILCNFIAKNFDISMYKDDQELNKIYLRIQIRNLLVHNRGVINKTFIEKTKSNLKIGQRIKINREYLDKTDILLVGNVNYISEQLI